MSVVRNKHFLLLIILSVVVLTGCTAGRGRDVPLTPTVYTGSEGVVLRFLPNYPPTLLYESDSATYMVIVEARNLGASTVTNGFIYLTGFDPSVLKIAGYTTFASQSISGLQGREDTLVSEGETRLVQFPILEVDIPEGTDSFPQNPTATACYNYKTKGTFPACIDENPYSTSVKSCVAGYSVPTSGSQGAPIAISSITEEATLGRALFQIYISNVGNGRVVPDVTQKECLNPGVVYEDKIYVNKLEISGIDIRNDCAGLNKDDSSITLINDQAILTCQLRDITGEARTVPLTIELEYAYAYTEWEEILLRKIA